MECNRQTARYERIARRAGSKKVLAKSPNPRITTGKGMASTGLILIRLLVRRHGMVTRANIEKAEEGEGVSEPALPAQEPRKRAVKQNCAMDRSGQNDNPTSEPSKSWGWLSIWICVGCHACGVNCKE